MEIFSSAFLLALLSIIILDLVLAGDNAVVIALASRNLPPHLKNKAIYWGTFGAVVIRVIMTVLATYLLSIPLLQAIGGIILLPIAIKLLKPHKEDTSNITASSNFTSAIKTIIIADAAMGIDNVLAIAGAAHGSMILVILGLLISIPIVVAGSQIIGRLMEKFPILILCGSAILAYTSATMILHDKFLAEYLLLIPFINLLLPIIFIGVTLLYYFRFKK